MSYLVLFSMTPIGRGTGVSRHVAKAVRVVAKSGLPWEPGSMGTTFEAPTLARAFSVLSACDRALRSLPRVSTLIKIDRRAGGMGRMAHKTAVIQTLLRRG